MMPPRHLDARAVDRRHDAVLGRLHARRLRVPGAPHVRAARRPGVVGRVKTYGRVCTICGTEYFRESEIDPAEPCWCGQMGDVSPWQWDRWRGLRTAARYRTAMLLYQLGDWLTERSHHAS